MREISARDLAAILTYEGADVESALLELASVAPSLDTNVRRALFWHNKPPELIFTETRRGSGLHYSHSPISRPVCAMHAVDAVTMVLDDADVVQYLTAKFPEYNWEKYAVPLCY